MAKRRSNRRACAFLLLFAPAFAAGQDAAGAAVAAGGRAQSRITLSAGWNHVPAYGSNADYALGTNDFPATPSHAAPSFGLSFGQAFASGLGWEIAAKYVPAAAMTLSDPSDGDTVKTESAAHADAVLSLVWELPRGRLRPYVAIGAGISTLLGVQDRTSTTAYGYDIFFAAPDKKTELLGRVGAGLSFRIGPRFGLRLEGEYVHTAGVGGSPGVASFGVSLGVSLMLK